MGMATLTDRAAAARGHSLKLYPEQKRSIVHRSVIQLDWEWLLTHVASNVDACQELARSVATTLHNRDAKLFTTYDPIQGVPCSKCSDTAKAISS